MGKDRDRASRFTSTGGDGARPVLPSFSSLPALFALVDAAIHFVRTLARSLAHRPSVHRAPSSLSPTADAAAKVGAKKRKQKSALSLDAFARAKKSTYDKRVVLEKRRALAAARVNKFRKVQKRLGSSVDVDDAFDPAAIAARLEQTDAIVGVGVGGGGNRVGGGGRADDGAGGGETRTKKKKKKKKEEEEDEVAAASASDSGAFYTLVPIRPRWRGERRSLRTLPSASLRPPLAFNPDTPRRLSTPPDAFELHPDIRLYRTPLIRRLGRRGVPEQRRREGRRRRRRRRRRRSADGRAREHPGREPPARFQGVERDAKEGHPRRQGEGGQGERDDGAARQMGGGR